MTMQSEESARMNSTPLSRRSTGWAFSGVVLLLVVAVNLRPSLTSVGPLLGDIGADEGLHEGALGILGAVPLFAFAVFSPMVSFIAERFGVERTIVIAMVTLATGSVIRSFLGLGGLWLGTVIVGCAIAVANVLIPVLVQRDFSSRVSMVTGLYTASLTIAAGIASAVAVPIAGAIGWRGALAVWAIPAVITAILWIPKVRSAPPATVDATRRPEPTGSVWKRLDAWLVTTLMGVQSAFFYIMVTWLPSIEIEMGESAEVAGIHLFVFIVAGIVSSLTVPRLMRRPDKLVPAALTAGIPMLSGALGIFLLPDLSYLWAAVAGFGPGAGLVLALSMISFRGRSTRDTTRLGGMVQSIGYLVAALGPIVVGFIARIIGDLQGTLIVLVVLASTQMVVGIIASKPRSPQDTR